MMAKLKIDMSLLKLTLSISLLFSVTNFVISEISKEDNNMTITTDIYRSLTPQHYNIRLDFYKIFRKHFSKAREMTFSGRCKIYVDIYNPTRNIILNASKPHIEIKYTNILDVNRGYSHSANTTYNDIDHSVNLYLSATLEPGHYLLDINFSGVIYDQAIFQTIYSKKTGRVQSVFATHLQPTKAGTLFPCFDNLQFKTTFNITITHSADFTVLSNMPMQETPVNNDRIIFTPFLETPLMYTHEVTVVIFDIDTLPGSIMRCRDSVQRFGEYANNIAYNVINALREWECFRNLTDATLVMIPGFPYDTMMNLGLTIFREEVILYDEEDKFQFPTRARVVNLVAHAVAYDRLKKFVISSWPYLWLNQGIAMLIGQAVVQKLYPEFRAKELFMVQIQQECMRLNSLFIMESSSKVKETPDFNTMLSFFHYIKGPVLLSMLQRLLTDDLFWKGINMYLSYPYLSRKVNFDDFCIAMEAIYRDQPPIKDLFFFNVRKEMNSWMKRRYFPELTAEQVEHRYLKIYINNFGDLESDNFYLPIAVMKSGAINDVPLYRVITERDITERSFIWDYNHTSRITSRNVDQMLYPTVHLYGLGLEDDDWIIVNAKQTGHYRVNYNLKNWRKIASYLNSGNYRKIDVLNRAQIIDDAFYFLMQGNLDLSIFLDLSKYLSQEIDYVAWFPMLKIFESISGFIPYNDSTFIKEQFATILGGALRFLQYKDHDMETDFTNTLRRELVKWECIFNSLRCTEYTYHNLIPPGSNTLTDVFKTTYFESLSPWWKEWVYCKGIMIQDVPLVWEDLLQMYLHDTRNRLLKYLACSEKPEIIRKYINRIIHNLEVRENIRKKGIRNFIDIFHAIVAMHSRNSFVLTNILENLQLFKPSNISTIVALADITNHVYSKELLHEILTYTKILPRKKKDLVESKIQLRLVQLFRHSSFFKSLDKNLL